MTPQEAQLFNFYMAIVLLKKAKEAMEKGETEKVKQISKLGIVYSHLCLLT